VYKRQEEEDTCFEVVKKELGENLKRIISGNMARHIFFKGGQQLLAYFRILGCADPTYRKGDGKYEN